MLINAYYGIFGVLNIDRQLEVLLEVQRIHGFQVFVRFNYCIVVFIVYFKSILLKISIVFCYFLNLNLGKRLLKSA